nr:hypothetical protein Iba_chr02dCG1350 [Ipomoea batatas]
MRTGLVVAVVSAETGSRWWNAVRSDGGGELKFLVSRDGGNEHSPTFPHRQETRPSWRTWSLVSVLSHAIIITGSRLHRASSPSSSPLQEVSCIFTTMVLSLSLSPPSSLLIPSRFVKPSENGTAVSSILAANDRHATDASCHAPRSHSFWEQQTDIPINRSSDNNYSKIQRWVHLEYPSDGIASSRFKFIVPRQLSVHVQTLHLFQFFPPKNVIDGAIAVVIVAITGKFEVQTRRIVGESCFIAVQIRRTDRGVVPSVTPALKVFRVNANRRV